jgi:hypothetical protein
MARKTKEVSNHVNRVRGRLSIQQQSRQDSRARQCLAWNGEARRGVVRQGIGMEVRRLVCLTVVGIPRCSGAGHGPVRKGVARYGRALARHGSPLIYSKTWVGGIPRTGSACSGPAAPGWVVHGRALAWKSVHTS